MVFINFGHRGNFLYLCLGSEFLNINEVYSLNPCVAFYMSYSLIVTFINVFQHCMYSITYI